MKNSFASSAVPFEEEKQKLPRRSLLYVEVRYGRNFKHANCVLRKTAPYAVVVQPKCSLLHGEGQWNEGLQSMKLVPSSNEVHLNTELSHFNTNPIWYECFVLEYAPDLTEGNKWFAIDVFNHVRMHQPEQLGERKTF